MRKEQKEILKAVLSDPAVMDAFEAYLLERANQHLSTSLTDLRLGKYMTAQQYQAKADGLQEIPVLLRVELKLTKRSSS